MVFKPRYIYAIFFIFYAVFCFNYSRLKTRKEKHAHEQEVRKRISVGYPPTLLKHSFPRALSIFTMRKADHTEVAYF